MRRRGPARRSSGVWPKEQPMMKTLMKAIALMLLLLIAALLATGCASDTRRYSRALKEYIDSSGRGG